MSTTTTEHRYTADDGAELGFLRRGSGAPLLCLPGGPGADVRYLGGLGGLDGHRTLVLVDQRATGRSPVPEDRARCRYAEQAHGLAGGRDGITGTAPARRTAELHDGSRLVVLPEAGHRLWHEEPKVFVDEVLAHLDA